MDNLILFTNFLTMNYFAWSITFKWNVPLNMKTKDFVIIKNLTIVWDSNIYFYGETKLNSKDEIIDYFKENIYQKSQN